MQKKLTITIDEEVYDGLHKHIGRGNISRFIERLVRPLVTESDLDEGYRQMAADEAYEAEAQEWIEGLIGDVSDETR
jgi:predicted CopG family antitoxin